MPAAAQAAAAGPAFSATTANIQPQPLLQRCAHFVTFANVYGHVVVVVGDIHRAHLVLAGDLPPQPFVAQQPPSDHYFMQHQHPTPPQTSGTFSDAGSELPHSIDILTELPTGGSLSYDQLAAATDGFSPDNVIGQGGFGCVYRGTLQDGTEVAIKKLKTGSKQGDREFRAEVEIITRVHHRNLVSLVGFCISGNERLLVYEFVPNKTLDTHLHGKPMSTFKMEKMYVTFFFSSVKCMLTV
jgi:hypothetical protein